MRLALRIPALVLLLCATASAHAATGDPDSSGAAPTVASDSAAARFDVSAGTPSGRYSHSAIMDPIRRRMVMHGGYVNSTFSDQWELTLDGASEWSPLAATSTQSRSAYVGVLDPSRDRMLMFGGWDNANRRNDTWSLSLGDNAGWSLLTTAGVRPSPRTLLCGIYDPVRDRLIVFGGYEDNAYLNDVWALSLSGTPTWTQLTPTGTPPTRRRESSAIYDPIRDRMIVFGGTDGGFYNEVWELRLGGAPAWARLTPAGSPPSARSGHSAVYDQSRDLMWVFGGRTASGEVRDLWTLSLSGNTQWQQQAPGGTLPLSRAYHSAVLDATGDRMIVFAGYTGAFPNDTWFLQLTGVPTWYPMGSEPHNPPTKPDPRFDLPPVVSATTIELGQSVTVSVSVRNQGTPSDDGIISMSFPSMTDPADGQWVESSASGDAPGYVELPAGSPMVTALGCQPMTASALAVEYRDDAWEGFGAEQNAFAVTVRPKAAGTFYVHVRSTMRTTGTTCEYENATPSGAGDQVVDQQGWSVRRIAITVVDSPGPVFTSGIALSATAIELGQTFTISATVTNVGAASDDGRIAIAFPGMTDPADAQWVSSASAGDSPGYLEHPAGSVLSNSSCQPITTTYLVAEYADAAWLGIGLGGESNAISVAVQPKAAGTFFVDVRSTMHRSGSSCEFANAVPSGGSPLLDPQGWAVRRFSVTVLDAPAPSFVAFGVPTTPITIGQTLTVGVNVSNTGAASDDGRIAFSFPDMTDPADAQWVSNTSPDADTPGYLERPAGSALTDASCQPITASYLVVEYADSDWRGLGAESNGLTVTVRPKAAGSFTIDMRATMRKSGATCVFVNGVPASFGGASAVDQQGWEVRRYSVSVLDVPAPAFVGSVILSANSIDIGQTFTVTATVSNVGATSDDGRIAISFPDLTDPADAQWVSTTSAGDLPGYLEHPAGASLTDASCQPLTASYLVAEYADGDWLGLSAENNVLALTVRPRAAGSFTIDVRSTMHRSGTPCEFVNAVPPGGSAAVDQQGWAVKRFTVTVTNEPIPSIGSPTYSTTTIEIGQTFTFSWAVANAGVTSDDGRIAFSFPAMTDPNDAQWVTSSSTGDAPGYLEHPAGSALTDKNCQPMQASYLMVEYADDSWVGHGTETNILSVTVQPKTAGNFVFYARTTLHWAGTACTYANAMPSGIGTAVDQQGWAVRTLSVVVLGAPAPEFTIFDPGPSVIELGQPLVLSAMVRNPGATSDDGRVAISFPGMSTMSDAQWVSSPSTGDSPGYLEHPPGSALTGVSCQPLTASYLMVEYADGNWLGLGAENNAFLVTVTPQVAGPFHIYVRATMRRSGTACEYVNALPSGGESGFTDQQGLPVRRFTVSVVGMPSPVFTTVSLSASAIGLGQTFTVTTTVTNSGASSPDGRIAISFPALTDPADAQWVSSTSAGDAPGYLEQPAGSGLTDASCQPSPASYLLAEYADGDWLRFDGESNSFSVTVRPQAIGTFYLYVRCTMRKPGPDACILVNGLPAGGEGGFVDQQGFPVKRFAVAVGPSPPPPAPVFTTFQVVSPAGGVDVISLGQTITLSVGVRNDGGWSGDGRVVFSPHSPCAVSMPGRENPAGSTLLDASCQPVVTTRAVWEHVDDQWEPGEIRSFQVVLTPQSAGTFRFDVRGTMLVTGTACGYANAVPTGGAPAIDELGWAVSRFSFIVRPIVPAPVFTTPVTGIPTSIAFGQSFTLSTTLGNAGTSSPDGRIVVAFPQLVETGDAVWVSSNSSGDTPGYRELPAGSPLTTTSCQSVTAPWLVAEYVDQNWGGYDLPGPENVEQNALVLTVTPQTVGDFFIYIRGTMRRSLATCGWENTLPAGGEGVDTDPQGWPVARFRVQVVAPLATHPDPVFTVPIEISATSIIQGDTFTLRARVRNDGTSSDQGIVSVSFPSLTSGADAQWITPLLAGDDVPGYQELPAGSVIPDAGCYYYPSSYLAVEYADDDWKGIQNGHELNELRIAIRPPATGTFYVYVRAAMRETGTECSYRTQLPSNGESGHYDQQGWAVKRFAITVLPVPPGTYEPVPLFLGPPTGLPNSITLGQSLTIFMSVRNDGLASDDGNITVSFPSFTSPSDAQWVSSPSSGDAPGYLEHPAGSPLPGADCQPGAASYLAVEYADASWLGAGAETNTLTLTIVPQAVGTFSIDIRATMHRSGAAPCVETHAVPPGGIGTFTDQQGRQVQRFQLGVFTIPEPGAPSTTWTLITPSSAGPAPRHGAALAHDEPHDELFLYGGVGAGYFADIWSLPLAPGSSWRQTLPGGSPPLRRIMHSMIHNPLEGHFVFFGGYYDGLLADLALLALRPVPWWFAIAPQGLSPSRRIGHTATYDPVRHRMILIGGYDGGLRNDVWAYPLPGNGTWIKLEPIGIPMPPRAQHTAAYDPVRDRVVVVGGDGGTFLNDAWELKLGVTPEWNRITVAELPPSGRREHTMVYDSDRDRMLVFGGFDGARRNDLWALTLASPPRWEQLFSTTPAPGPRSMHGAIYDRFRRRMVMFGGQVGSSSYSNELWQVTDNAPTPALASLVSTECLPDRVRLTWAVETTSPIRAEIHRSAGESEGWTVVGSPEADGDRLVFEDRDVTPGARLGYRLVEREASGETVLNEVWVKVPLRLGLALAGASPNPAEGDLHVAFSLPAEGAATLELFDLRGRLMARRDVGGLGPGEHRVRFDDAGRVRAGVYLVRLVRGDRVLTAKACVIR